MICPGLESEVPKLVVLEQGQKKVYNLTRDVTRVGRAPDSHVPLRDPRIGPRDLEQDSQSAHWHIGIVLSQLVYRSNERAECSILRKCDIGFQREVLILATRIIRACIQCILSRCAKRYAESANQGAIAIWTRRRFKCKLGSPAARRQSC